MQKYAMLTNDVMWGGEVADGGKSSTVIM